MPTAADWAGEMGRNWVARVDAMERQLAPLAELGLAVLAPQPGERIVDIGCGGGATSRMIAERVGPEGTVTAVDISPDLVALARRRGEGLSHLTTIEADAEHHPFAPGAHDALFSRLGCMFFDHPEPALANLRRALTPEGRAVFAVFTGPEDNPWGMVPMQAVEAVLGPPPADAPRTPGPFSWADPETVATLLCAAGFAAPGFSAHDLTFAIGDGDARDPVDRAIHLLLRIGPVAARLRDEPEAAAEAVARDLAPRLAPYVCGDAVHMPARALIVEAAA